MLGARWAGLALLAALTGCGPLVYATRPISMTAEWRDWRHLVVRNENGSVELRCGAVGEVRIEGTKRAGGLTLTQANENVERVEVVARPDPRQADTLRVEVEYPAALRASGVGASLRIQVPQACAAEVATGNGRVTIAGQSQAQVRTSNGRVVVEDVNGPVDVRTSNGSIRLGNVAGPVKAETSNGEVFGQRLSGPCVIETSNGRVELLEVTGNVQVRTSNGSIRAQVRPAEEGEVILTTSNGSIDATIPPHIRGKLTLRAGNGRLDTSLGPATLTDPRWSHRSLEAALNGGGAGQVVLRTSNGSIRLECR